MKARFLLKGLRGVQTMMPAITPKLKMAYFGCISVPIITGWSTCMKLRLTSKTLMLVVMQR